MNPTLHLFMLVYHYPSISLWTSRGGEGGLCFVFFIGSVLRLLNAVSNMLVSYSDASVTSSDVVNETCDIIFSQTKHQFICRMVCYCWRGPRNDAKHRSFHVRPYLWWRCEYIELNVYVKRRIWRGQHPIFWICIRKKGFVYAYSIWENWIDDTRLRNHLHHRQRQQLKTNGNLCAPYAIIIFILQWHKKKTFSVCVLLADCCVTPNTLILFQAMSERTNTRPINDPCAVIITPNAWHFLLCHLRFSGISFIFAWGQQSEDTSISCNRLCIQIRSKERRKNN